MSAQHHGSMRKTAIITAIALAGFLLVSCGEETRYQPKPKGYFRIDLPAKNYIRVDTIEKYAFEAPDYSTVSHDPFSPQEKNWINVEMPCFKASIHLTHKDVNGNLGEYLEDVHTMITKHL